MSEQLNALVRPVCTIMVVLAMCIAFTRQTFVWQLDVKDAFIGMAGIIIGWYFGKRDATREGGTT